MSSNELNRKTRSAKRKNESPTTENTTQKPKKQKPFKLTSKDMDEPKNILTNLQSQLANSHNTLEAKIDNIGAKLDSDINSINNKFENYASNISSNIVTIESELYSHSERIFNTEDDIKRVTLLNQLRILGFPAVINENLMGIFDGIAKKIGYVIQNQNEIPTISRIPIRSRGTGEMINS